jgi:hypothetical protein
MRRAFAMDLGEPFTPLSDAFVMPPDGALEASNPESLIWMRLTTSSSAEARVGVVKVKEIFPIELTIKEK